MLPRGRLGVAQRGTIVPGWEHAGAWLGSCRAGPLIRRRLSHQAHVGIDGADRGRRLDALRRGLRRGHVGYFTGPHGGVRVSGQDISRIQAAGGAHSSVADLYALDRVLQGSVLSAETYAEIVTQVSDRFACGWSIRPILSWSLRFGEGQSDRWSVIPPSANHGRVLFGEVQALPIELRRDEAGLISEAHWIRLSGRRAGGARGH